MLPCAWVPSLWWGGASFPSSAPPFAFPASSFLPLLGRRFSRPWRTDALLLRFPAGPHRAKRLSLARDCSLPPPPAPAPGPLHPTSLSPLFSELPPAWLRGCDNEVSATERSGLGGAEQQARGPGDRLEQAQRLPQLALESSRCPPPTLPGPVSS